MWARVAGVYRSERKVRGGRVDKCSTSVLTSVVVFDDALMNLNL